MSPNTISDYLQNFINLRNHYSIRNIAKGLGDEFILEALPTLREVDLNAQLIIDKVKEFRVIEQEQGYTQWTIEDQKGFIKKHLHMSTPVELFSGFGPVWQLGMSIAYNFLPVQARKYVVDSFHALHIFSLHDSVHISEILKMITKRAKKFKSLIGQEWPYLVDWQNLGGVHGVLQTQEQRDAFFEDIVEFVRLKDHNQQWKEEFPKCVNAVIESWPWKVEWEKIFPPKEFLARRTIWATVGSAGDDARHLDVLLDGKRARSRQTKWSAALAMDVDELYELVNNPNPNSYRVHPFPKVETGYRTIPRAVVSASFSLYLNMAMLSQVFEGAYHGDNRCLAWSDDPVKVIRLMCIDAMKNSEDQSQFDHGPTREDLICVVDILERQTAMHWPPGLEKWYEGCFNRIRELMLNAKVIYDGRELKWLGGLLSGWRWTSMMGSIINLAQHMCVCNILGIPQLHPVVMGDDFIEVETCSGNAVSVWKCMIDNGFTIKPGDSTIDKEGEFVRYRITHNGAFGYPIRGIPSLIYREDFSQKGSIGLGELHEVVDHYNLLVGRGMSKNICTQYLKESVTSILGDGTLTNEWIASPRSGGGGGLWSWTPFSYTLWSLGVDRYYPDTSSTFTNEKGLEFMKLYLNKEEIDRAILDLVTVPKIKYKIARAQIIKSKYALAKWTDMGVINSDLGGWSVIPLWLHTQSTLTGFGVVVEKLVRNGNYDLLRSWMQPESIITYDMLLKRANSRVVDAWLLGKLPFSSPVVEGINPSVVSKIHKCYVQVAWNKFCSYQHLRWSPLLELAVSAEGSVAAHIRECSEFFVWSP